MNEKEFLKEFREHLEDANKSGCLSDGKLKIQIEECHRVYQDLRMNGINIFVNGMYPFYCGICAHHPKCMERCWSTLSNRWEMLDYYFQHIDELREKMKNICETEYMKNV